MNTRNTSRGFTLIELVMVLSLLGSCLAGAVGLLTIVRDSDAEAKKNLLRRMEIRRFASDLRRDVRTAAAIESTQQQLTIMTRTLNSSIVYQTQSGQVVTRTVTNSDDTPQANDQYALGDHAEMSIALTGEGDVVQWTIRELDQATPAIQIIAAKRTAP